MSALPVYIWYPDSFENPQRMLPTSLEAAQMLLEAHRDEPPSARADAQPFLAVARRLAEAALHGGFSDRFSACYQDIEIELTALAARHAIVEVPERGTYDELMLVLVDACAEAGMVLYDSHGKIWLPDGREIPEDDELMDLPTLLRPLAVV